MATRQEPPIPLRNSGRSQPRAGGKAGNPHFPCSYECFRSTTADGLPMTEGDKRTGSAKLGHQHQEGSP